MVGETNDRSQTADLVDGIFDHVACVFVEDGEDVMERDASGFELRPPGELLRDAVHEGNVAFSIAGDDSVADAANGSVQPLLTGVGHCSAGSDLFDLTVVDNGELVEESSRLPYEQGCYQGSKDDEADERGTVDAIGNRRAADADRLFGMDELLCLRPYVVHVPLSVKHVCFYP